MSVDFRSETRPEYLRVEIAGDFSHEEMLPLCDRFFAEAADAGRNAVLVDARGISGRQPMMAERYELAVRIAELQARYEPRIRVALMGSHALIHPERFGEIVARNRGADARAFTEEAPALDWLLGGKRPD